MDEYVFATQCVIRIPRNPFEELRFLCCENVKMLFKREDILESVYVASSDLYKEIQRYTLLNDKEKRRVVNSFIRYLSRMSTRSTPFGLFAGCTIGNTGEETQLVVTQNYIRHTRLDMNYLCACLSICQKYLK